LSVAIARRTLGLTMGFAAILRDTAVDPI